MFYLKKPKSFLLTTGLALGLSCIISVNTYAASPSAYTAVSGDSLYKISRIFNTTVDRLMNDNNLKTYNLGIGQELKVPCIDYTVQKGDTIFLIARKYNIPMTTLQRANNIYSDYLDIGQSLIIPIVSSQSSDAGISSAGTVSAEAVSGQFTSVIDYTNEELDLLARLIHAEAQGESYSAKVGVGAVVVNRIQSGLFPGTIKAVIYQNINGYYQFTPVVNGWIDKPADEDALKAAKEALSGADPSNGALFYYDKGTTNPWMLAKKVSAEIGNMIFAY